MSTNTYIIAGPTASGKSDLAHRIARATGGVIINCDSVQIYRGIEVISASPFARLPVTPDIDGVPYRLFSILDLSQQISVADYLRLARAEYDWATAAGRPAIFVGGTGYYINAILNGISPMPDVSDDVRQRAREMVATDAAAARRMLPADFPFTDPQRVARALEIFLQTGRHITDFQRMPRTGAIAPHARRILINPPVATSAAGIARRIEKMLKMGALDDARRIIDSNWDVRRAIGAAQACALVRGDMSRDAAIADWAMKTRQYAKRQRTWFRTQFAADIEFNDIPTDDDIAKIIA